MIVVRYNIVTGSSLLAAINIKDRKNIVAVEINYIVEFGFAGIKDHQVCIENFICDSCKSNLTYIGYFKLNKNAKQK